MHTRLAARYIRGDFAAKGKVKRAVAYVAGLGVCSFMSAASVWGQSGFAASTNRLSARPFTTIRSMSLRSDQKNAIAIKLGNGRMFPMRLEKAYKTPFSVIRNAAST